MEAISDRIVQSVVKINNKGWNRSLFIASESQLSHLQCKSCAHICCEPVILNCPQHHDTSEDVDQYAQMYCYQCLMQMIEDNNNKCIIQGHSNPIVFRIKQIKKIIRATTVHCPYSLHMGDQQRHNNPDNHHVYDTPDDQDENKQHEGQSFNTCQWKGTLALLLTQHLPICIHKHDPMYVLNHQINALQHQVACYKRKVKSYEHKIKTLQCHRCSAEQKVNDNTDIDPSAVYSICDLYGNYLSYDKDGFCMQNDTCSNNSCFKFIPWVPATDVFYIQNKNICSDMNYFLSFKRNKQRPFQDVTATVNLLHGKSYAGVWKVIRTSSRNKAMDNSYILVCYYDNKLKGYLGVEENTNRNQLYLSVSEYKACIYRLRKLQCQANAHEILTDAVYSIRCYYDGKEQSYVSYSATGYIMGGYEATQSRFTFIRADEDNTWFIQNKYNDKRLNYWMSFDYDKKISLYQDETDRAKWKLIPLNQKSMCFRIECCYQGEVVRTKIINYYDIVFELQIGHIV